MEDITQLRECVGKAEEIKKGLSDTSKKEEHDMLGKNSMNTEYSTSESPVSEQNDSEEEELKPIAAVYVKVEMDEGSEEQEDQVADYPMAGCEEWDKKKSVTDSWTLRRKNKTAVEAEEGAGTSNERSEQEAFKKTKDDAENASGSTRNRAKSPCEEREASKPQSKNVPTHTNRQPFACVHCSETFRYKRMLKDHQREHQGETKLLKCDICQRQYTSQRALWGHMRMHMTKPEKETKFPCETCGKEFTQRGSVKVHMRIHTGEKPYVCEHCGKRFTHRYNFNVHRRIHTGEQPYSCPICNKRFADKSHLVLHTRRHLNIKPYECKECGKTFVQSNQYKMHLRIHTGEKPHKCSVCSKRFVTKGPLKRHMFTHSREQKHMSECEVCGESFKTTHMISHMRTHTGERPYSADLAKQRLPKAHVD